MLCDLSNGEKNKESGRERSTSFSRTFVAAAMLLKKPFKKNSRSIKYDLKTNSILNIGHSSDFQLWLKPDM